MQTQRALKAAPGLETGETNARAESSNHTFPKHEKQSDAAKEDEGFRQHEDKRPEAELSLHNLWIFADDLGIFTNRSSAEVVDRLSVLQLRDPSLDSSSRQRMPYDESTYQTLGRVVIGLSLNPCAIDMRRILS
ncbi:hypothetical protein E4T40_00311 [Aureobasidium subglaciale]|nr:hypothetical protein E4T40_00311 [Aureobasidium subglaciale]